MMKQINLGKVDKLMDDMYDLQLDQEEINEVMSRNYALDNLDEDELEEELAELDNEIFEDNLVQGEMNAPSYLPSTPQEEAKVEELPSVPS
jgi:hypothetical protein